jgi:hypothetical protein
MSIALCNQGLIETLGGQNLINTMMEQSEQVCESPIMQSFGRQYSGERKSARAEFLGIWVTLGYRKSATKERLSNGLFLGSDGDSRQCLSRFSTGTIEAWVALMFCRIGFGFVCTRAFCARTLQPSQACISSNPVVYSKGCPQSIF